MQSTWWRNPTELITEQAELLDFPIDANISIKGPPGSGKTNLLLLRANQMYLGSKKNILVIVFGSLLKEFIRMGGAQYKFPAEKIITHTSLFDQILRTQGVTLDTRALDIQAARHLREQRILALIEARQIGKEFEAILLDEAQDYTPGEIRIFQSISQTLVTASDSRQRIYNVEDCFVALEGSTPPPILHELHVHFRNGLEICRLADGVMQGTPEYSPLHKSSNYDERTYPSRVSKFNGQPLPSQAEEIIKQLRIQIVSYPSQFIGVMCPRNEEVDALFEKITATPDLRDLTTRVNNNFDPQKVIWLTTLTAAKGLEFRASHIAGLDHLHKMGGVQKRLIYTGITRAKTSLSLYWNASIPGYLESSIANLHPVRKAVTMHAIFGSTE